MQHIKPEIEQKHEKIFIAGHYFFDLLEYISNCQGYTYTERSKSQDGRA
jgi:hypothetical protein